MQKQQYAIGLGGPLQHLEEIDFADTHIAIVARMTVGEQDLVLLRGRIDPGVTIPLHTHCDVECLYILDGSVRVYVGSEPPGWRRVEAGSSLILPPNVKHAIRNTLDRPVDMVVATTARLAQFLREIGSRQRGQEDDRSKLENLQFLGRKAKEYGYWLASPEEHEAIVRLLS